MPFVLVDSIFPRHGATAVDDCRVTVVRTDHDGHNTIVTMSARNPVEGELAIQKLSLVTFTSAEIAEMSATPGGLVSGDQASAEAKEKRPG
jgi:hypothetical protein